MLYMQFRTPIAREGTARAELRRFAVYGASIHQRGTSRFWDLLIPLDQRKVERQARWFEQNWPGHFHLVRVHTFDSDGGVVAEPVLMPNAKSDNSAWLDDGDTHG